MDEGKKFLSFLYEAQLDQICNRQHTLITMIMNENNILIKLRYLISDNICYVQICYKIQIYAFLILYMLTITNKKFVADLQNTITVYTIVIIVILINYNYNDQTTKLISIKIVMMIMIIIMLIMILIITMIIIIIIFIIILISNKSFNHVPIYFFVLIQRG